MFHDAILRRVRLAVCVFTVAVAAVEPGCTRASRINPPKDISLGWWEAVNEVFVGQRGVVKARYGSSDGTYDDTKVPVYSSDDPDVLTVDKDGNVLGLSTKGAETKTVHVRASLVGDPRVISREITVRRSVSAIAIGPVDKTAQVGGNYQLTVTPTYVTGAPTNVTPSYAYSSTAITVATVNASGNVIPVTVGTTTLRAAVDGITSNDAKLTVMGSTPLSLRVTPASANASAGGTATFVLNQVDANNQNVPVGATQAAWTIAPTTVATIGASGAATCASQGAGGSATVTATYVPSGVTATAQITCAAVITPPTIVVAPRTETIQVGAGTKPITATITNAVAGSIVTWVSKDDAIASLVVRTGTNATIADITGKVAGSTYIVAIYTGGQVVLRDSVLLTVTAAAAPVVARMLIEARDAQITAPATTVYTALLFDAQGNRITTVPTGGTVFYSSSNTAAATIVNASNSAGNLTGVATGVSAGGTTTITGRYMKGTTQVTTDETPLIVYPAGSVGHYGSLTISVPLGARQVGVTKELLVTVLVYNVNNSSVTTNVASLTLESNNPAIEIVRDLTGVNRFFVRGKTVTVTGTAADPTVGVVKVTADIMGAAASIYMVVVP